MTSEPWLMYWGQCRGGGLVLLIDLLPYFMKWAWSLLRGRASWLPLEIELNNIHILSPYHIHAKLTHGYDMLTLLALNSSRSNNMKWILLGRSGFIVRDWTRSKYLFIHPCQCV